MVLATLVIHAFCTLGCSPCSDRSNEVSPSCKAGVDAGSESNWNGATSTQGGASSTGAFAPTGRPGRFLDEVDVSKFQRGNLHTHSTESDGDHPPEDVYRWYRDQGYNFLALSDHNTLTQPHDFRALETASFVMIPAEEITMQSECKEIHVNALCHRETIGGGSFDSVREALQYSIGNVLAQGGVALVNHPNVHWSITADDLPSANGAKLLEIWSGHPWVHTHGDCVRPSHEAIWDRSLSNGLDFTGVAVDDMHELEAPRGANAAGPGRGWVDVFAENANVEEICAALRSGRLVASTGVRVSRLVVDGDSIGVFTSVPFGTVEFIGFGGATLARQSTRTDGTMNVYKLQGGESYVRVRITAPDGTRAWTHAFRTTDPQRRVR
jgi:hypothetical protein